MRTFQLIVACIALVLTISWFFLDSENNRFRVSLTVIGIIIVLVISCALEAIK
jgi:hypothetical protein